MLPETGKAEGLKEGEIKRKKRRKDWNCKRNAKKRTRCKTNKWYYKNISFFLQLYDIFEF